MTNTPIRVLVLGGTGMLGHKLVHVLSSERDLEVYCTVRQPPESRFKVQQATYLEGVDLQGGSGPLAAALERVAPTVIVNAIGAIKQKDLGTQVDKTFFLNGTLPHLTSILARNPETRVIHISTDCVFRGDRGDYVETDAPDALDVYGRSKAVGELDYGGHLTLRTSIIGFEIAGFLGLVSWLMRQQPGSTLSGYRRAIFSGLPTLVLSREILEQIRSQTPLRGLYHVASEPISKHDLLTRLNDAFDLGHDIVPDDVLEVDRTLDDSAFRAATGSRRPGWDELVAAMKQDFESFPYGDLYSHKNGLNRST